LPDVSDPLAASAFWGEGGRRETRQALFQFLQEKEEREKEEILQIRLFTPPEAEKERKKKPRKREGERKEKIERFCHVCVFLHSPAVLLSAGVGERRKEGEKKSTSSRNLSIPHCFGKGEKEGFFPRKREGGKRGAVLSSTLHLSRPSIFDKQKTCKPWRSRGEGTKKGRERKFQQLPLDVMFTWGRKKVS